MNAALLYRPRGRWTFWIAFACAAAIHLGAVVLAKSKSERTTVQDFMPPGTDVELINGQPEPESPQESTTPPSLDQVHPDEDMFVEENRTQPLVRARKKTRAASLVKGTAAPFGSVKALVLYAPRPVYPYEARRQRTIGSGTALLTVDPISGEVSAVHMLQSSRSVILDSATIEAFRRWRFKPGTVARVQVPITYMLTGASY
jgi:TonB family protein